MFYLNDDFKSKELKSINNILNSPTDTDTQTGYPNQTKMIKCGERLLPYLYKTHTKAAYIGIEFFNIPQIALLPNGTIQSIDTWKILLDTIQNLLPQNAYLGRTTLGIAIHVFEKPFVENIKEHLEEISQKLENIEIPSILNQSKIPLSISSNIAYLIYPYDLNSKITHTEIIRLLALTLRNEKKKKTPSIIKRYSIKDSEDIIKKLGLEQELHKSILANEFELLYQPRLNTSTGEIIGAEALSRWNTKGLNSFDTGQYIEILEKSKYIVDFTYASFTKYMKFIQENHYLFPKGFKISFNLSPIVFSWNDFDLIQMIQNVCYKDFSLAKYIELEITESTYFSKSSFHNILSIFKEVQKMGIEIAIDDFGTGHSSLAILTENISKTIKLDRKTTSSLMRMKKDKNNFLFTIIRAAKESGFTIVAEGIETEEELETVNTLNIDIVQGHYISKPLKEVNFINFLEQF